MEVAQTILAQLGGKKFIVMTGSRNFVYSKNTLTFKVPANITKGKGQSVRITLNGMDLYDLELFKIRKFEPVIIGKEENIQAEDLQASFTRLTGLDTRMGQIIIAS